MPMKKKQILLIGIPAVVIIALLVMLLSGVFRGNPSASDSVRYERPFIKTSQAVQAPASLSELLNVARPSLAYLLADEKLSSQLLGAESLTEIVDSRLSLHNLRQLRDDAAQLIKEQAAQASLSGSPATASSSYVQPVAAANAGNLAAIKGKIDQLLTPAITGSGQPAPQIDLKGVWTAENAALLRWTPHDTWIPEQGYRLWRTVNGQTVEIASQLGTEAFRAANLDKNAEYAGMFNETFATATLTSEKLALIGIQTLAEFAELAYSGGTPNALRERVSGELDFGFVKNSLLTVPGSLQEKLPATDASQAMTLQVGSLQMAESYAFSSTKLFNLSALTVKPLLLARPLDNLAAAKAALVNEILESRQGILAKAYTSLAFAEDAGFAYKDQLAGLNLPNNTTVSYRLEAGDGLSASVEITTGQETAISQPLGLAGYGVDNRVDLRWQSAADPVEKSLIAGYWIERKKSGENGFKRLNAVPVAISYALDETGVFFESPSFFEDREIANGESAAYRIQALDIFGRTSEFSAELPLSVYKVTPPGTPGTDQPLLSSDAATRPDAFYQKIVKLNPKITGVILPISKTSADTVSFVVYRARALGAGNFGEPAKIGEAAIGTAADREIKSGNVRLIANPKAATAVDLAFYDGEIERGYSYKYWAAAVDAWGNESAWSTARVIGLPATEIPAVPSDLQAVLLRNILPDLSLKAPGFGLAIVNNQALAAEQLSKKPVATRTDAAEVVTSARSEEIEIGLSLSSLSISDGSQVPRFLSAAYGNLPDPDEVHAIVALGYDDLRPDKTALVNWKAFSGNGLAGYHVYRADADGTSVDDLQKLGRPAVLEKYNWKLVKSQVTANQLVDITLAPQPGRLHLYLVCLVPESRFGADLKLGAIGVKDGFSSFAPGGWVKLTWQRPADPQVKSYRIYRAEVESFTSGQDPAQLGWNLVGERSGYTSYMEKVDQTYAHYYYYRVTSVDVWGQESAATTVIPFRVAATSPPQTPAMLLPLAQKGKIQVNWAGVAHASKYVVYRSTLPKISEEDLYDLQVNQAPVFNSLFKDATAGDIFLDSRLSGIGVRLPKPSADTPVLSVDKFNTLQLLGPAELQTSISKISPAGKLALFQKIADKYGPLALRSYGQLSEAAANLVLWDRIAEVVPGEGQEPLGAFKYVDETVTFGDTYYYSVQAVNDDNLASARPLPVTATPRKIKAFDPVGGLKGQVENGKPLLTWNQAKDENLTWVKSREFVAGYIVYRSTAENGPYYQASPLLSELKWRDEKADLGAFNWYKVKVVDTAGYLSDFSAAVMVRSLPVFLIKDPLLAVTPDLPAGTALVTLPGRPVYDTYQTLTIGSYKITNAKMLRTSTGVTSGTGTMTFGHDETFEVLLDSVYLGSVPGVDPLVESRILRGTVLHSKAVYLPKSGVTFTRLEIAASSPLCRVSGYLQSPVASGGTVTQNLMGDLYALPFNNSSITADGRFEVADVPGFRYGQLVIAPSKNAVVTLNQNARLPSLVELAAGTAVYHLDLETLDNSGFQYTYSILSFNPAGQLSGKLTLATTQTLRLVIPAGMGIQASTSVLTYADGSIVASGSTLKGKILLPFTTFDDTYVPTASPDRINLNSDPESIIGFDRFLPEGITDKTPAPDVIVKSMTAAELADLDASIAYLAGRIQGTSLLVMPSSPLRQAKLSTVALNLAQWSGHGILVAETTMTPANVGNSGADSSAAIGVTPGKVGLDLDRQAIVAAAGAPAETQENSWLGIIVKEGRLALPAAYVKQDNGKRISFGLTNGELLYDLNGFAYQNLIYNAQGTPVDFGEKLGSFRDVKIFDCMLDLYGNHVNIEMNGELGIPLFGYEKAKVRLYTNKDGDLVCTMAETPYIDAAKTGQVQARILGGTLMPDGLHVNGTLNLNFPDKLVLADVPFNELIIPADMEKLTESGNVDRHYGQALFEQPQLVKFHDFPIELRAISFSSTRTSVSLSQLEPVYAAGLTQTFKLAGKPLSGKTVNFYQSSLTLFGGLQLSDNIALNVTEDFDRIVLDQAMSAPAINYDASVAHMQFEFEEFIKVSGVVKPEPASDGDKGYVEYAEAGESIDMAFNTICDLAGYPVQSNTRFGYDYENERYFFALGSYYDDPDGISFYYGKMLDINGVIGYNVDLPKEGDGRFAVPKGKDALFNAVDTMPVNRTADGNYFFASTVILQFGISYEDATIKIVEVRDCYIFVDKGPNLESGGDLYTPLDFEELVTHGDFTYTGYTRIGYYHPQRLFQFDSVIEEMKTYSLTVSGEVGCEMNPVFWEVRIGYPDALEAKGTGLFESGFGIMFRSSEVPDDSYIRAKIYFNFDAEGNISIVYVRAFLYAGAEGYYDIDAEKFVLDTWLSGGVEGGIKVAGKRYNIISLMLSANGQIIGQSGQGWALGATAQIYYSLDLWVKEYEGSVSWHISHSF